MHAYIDESYPKINPSAAENLGHQCLVGALIADPAVEEALADTARRLRNYKGKGKSKKGGSGAGKLHWRELDGDGKRRVASGLAGGKWEGFIISRVMTDSRKQDPARRRGLGELCPELEKMGVSKAVIESRKEQQDKKDVEAVETWRQHGQLRGTLRVEHQAGQHEPLLWYADAIIGAYGDKLRGMNGLFDEFFADRVTIMP